MYRYVPVVAVLCVKLDTVNLRSDPVLGAYLQINGTKMDMLNMNRKVLKVALINLKVSQKSQ